MNKIYTTSDHVKKILRSLPSKYRSNVTTIQEAKDFNKVSLEILIRNLQSHEMELMGDEPAKKSKSLSLKSVGQSAKSPQIQKPEEFTHAGGFEEDSYDEEM